MGGGFRAAGKVDLSGRDEYDITAVGKGGSTEYGTLAAIQDTIWKQGDKAVMQGPAGSSETVFHDETPQNLCSNCTTRPVGYE